MPPEKERISLTQHRHLTGGSTIPKQTEEIVLHSGECNWMFKFKLVGIERLNKVFDEFKESVATNNLNTEPRNITLKYNKMTSINKNFLQIDEGRKLISGVFGDS